MAGDKRRVAVILFNLGGPDSPDAVRSFLFNLFNDPAIISLPGPARWLLAQYISRRRTKLAQNNYALIGGGSPLLANTMKQANALQAALDGKDEIKCFISMRYWHPFSDETVSDVKAFQPDHVILLPLYPQFAAATTGSSISDWNRATAKAGLDVPTRAICCYPVDSGFISSMAKLTIEAWKKAESVGNPRILFSAHGLPKREIERGDPYQWQIEQTAEAIASAVSKKLGSVQEWLVSYPSRVGRLEWLGPYTDAEIERAGHEKRPLVIVPLAFVSEHVETLVELDIEYRELADEYGVPAYERVPTVSEHPDFIDGLAEMVRLAIKNDDQVQCGQGLEKCPADKSRCPCIER
jgi:ferrochelatase